MAIGSLSSLSGLDAPIFLFRVLEAAATSLCCWTQGMLYAFMRPCRSFRDGLRVSKKFIRHFSNLYPYTRASQ